MNNAGRILILPRGDYDHGMVYKMLDLVTYNNVAYLCRKECLRIIPGEDTKEYWQAFSGGGDYTEFVKKTELGSTAFSNDYEDLDNKPGIPSALSDLTDDESHRTVTDQEKEGWNGGAGKTFDTRDEYDAWRSSSEYDQNITCYIKEQSVADSTNITHDNTNVHDAIDEINDDIVNIATWELIGTTIGQIATGSGIDIPSDATDLFISVENQYGQATSCTIAPQFVRGANKSLFQGGADAAFAFVVNNNHIALRSYRLANTDYTSTATTKVYAKRLNK